MPGAELRDLLHRVPGGLDECVRTLDNSRPGLLHGLCPVDTGHHHVDCIRERDRGWPGCNQQGCGPFHLGSKGSGELCRGILGLVF